MTRTILALSLLLHGVPVARGDPPKFIVWNVGQGLWVTWSSATECLHFDMGGEFADRAGVAGECGQKKNAVVFSHWDWDHINFAGVGRRLLKNLCVLQWPGGDTNAVKLAYLKRLPDCDWRPRAALLELKAVVRGSLTANGASRVFVFKGALLPGDSDGRAERYWSPFARPHKPAVLILGHHGSRTSTTPQLVRALERTRTAIASARKRVYGHPHSIVVSRLRSAGISVLPTEDWGHVVFTSP
ncbi:MAG TPA: hypothetical protein VFV50_06180 [Bdellovibrionales bacterium]|nr:hypothetical protein [Bdellovibrionales bacterium]